MGCLRCWRRDIGCLIVAVGRALRYRLLLRQPDSGAAWDFDKARPDRTFSGRNVRERTLKRFWPFEVCYFWASEDADLLLQAEQLACSR